MSCFFDKFTNIFVLYSAFVAIGAYLTTASKSTYDVSEFGAVGDGKTYDTKAFQAAWKAACQKATGNVKITVSGGKTFLVPHVVFQGPCKANSITFEISGSIVAPPRSAWKNKGGDEWLYFHKVERLNVAGNGEGVIDGRGDTWWNHEGNRHATMRFSHCNQIQIRGLKYRNSQRNHLSINQCNKAIISDLEMTAPAESPNTDGIDISSSTDLQITDCVMETGDDCIAINAGTSNVAISNIKCGPGHGISIGSLGKKGSHEEVEGIIISNCTFDRSDNGVRIKTWQGGSGFARNITFSNITFIAAKHPVIIDQYYCPHKKCANKKSAVKVSDVKYFGLHGTSVSKDAIELNCSKTVPCNNIILEDIDIKSAYSNSPTSARCTNAHGRTRMVNPIVNCLKK